METYNDWLAHNGIKNQRWGVKNGPPYPLKNSARSAAEKKANKVSVSSKKLEKKENLNNSRRSEVKKIKKSSNKKFRAEISSPISGLGLGISISKKGIKINPKLGIPESIKEKFKRLSVDSKESFDSLKKKVEEEHNELKEEVKKTLDDIDNTEERDKFEKIGEDYITGSEEGFYDYDKESDAFDKQFEEGFKELDEDAWERMQADYDLFMYEERLADEIKWEQYAPQTEREKWA